MSNTVFKKILPFFLITMSLSGMAQSFEGTLKMDLTAHDKSNTWLLTVKGNKIISHVVIDSSQEITTIKDFDAGSTTMLRRKNDLKYGFTINTIFESDSLITNGSLKTDNITKSESGEMKTFGNLTARKIYFTGDGVNAEAWIANDLNIRLSNYFPELLSSGEEKSVHDIRTAADNEGLIVDYWEKQTVTGDVTSFRVLAEAKEIPGIAFHIPADYLVLNRESLRSLLSDAQTNSESKRRLDEFQEVF